MFWKIINFFRWKTYTKHCTSNYVISRVKGLSSPVLCISGGIRVRIPQELNVLAFWSWNLDVVVFWSWNLNVVAFCTLKKHLGIMMLWLICFCFLMLWCFSSWISVLRFFGPGILMLWFFGLGIPMWWYMCPHGLVFVIIVKIKKSCIIMSTMLLKNISSVQIYAISICITYA